MYLEERVETFLHSMKAKLEEMGDAEFEEQKKGLEKKWREGLKTLKEETNRFWAHIESGLLDFDRR
jgi:insulysin